MSGSDQKIPELDTNEQLEARIVKLQHLAEAGFTPYRNGQQVVHSTAAVVEKFAHATPEEFEAAKADPETGGVRYIVAGRIMLHRHMGKSTFFHIQDRHGRLQIFARVNDVGEQAYEHVVKKADLGDIVAVRGYPFKTRTGELSLHAERVELLTKCVRPPPEKFHGLTDVEARYRQRYVDLFVNPDVRDTFIKRSNIVRFIRNYFDEHGYLEVETPMMHAQPGGATARPFVTHHNTLDMELYLRVAPELHLKRLIVGGLERVYEINRNFRNEGIDTQHNPEFTMIEFYQAYATYEDLMRLTEDLLSKLCVEIHGTDTITYQGHELSFRAPFKRISISEAVAQLRADPVHAGQVESFATAARHAFAKRMEGRELELRVDYAVFEELGEKLLTQPTFVTGFPASVSPLARRNDADPLLVDRFELFVMGREIANAFSELNDPADQADRFRAQVAAKAAGDQEAMAYDTDYVRALQYGMPPTAGEGIGIDRLVMLLTDAPSIRDVILFPLQRREE